MKRGKLIVLEGPNGCGKGTQFFGLARRIYELNLSQTLFLTREPNFFDDNGKRAREMLSAEGDPYQNKLQALEYFSRNRETHNEIFRPMLDCGITVISDRYKHSTMAFQHAQGIPIEEILKYNHRFAVPDMTIVLDVPTEELVRRLEKRDGEKRRKFDNQQEFLEKVALNYRKLPSLLPEEKIQVIDGTQTPEIVSEEIWKTVRPLFDN